MQNNNRNKFVQGAAILTIAAFLVKILSAVYRIPYQNITGDYGMYVYQQLYPFYATFGILASNAFPMLLSRLYATKRHKEHETEQAAVLLGVLLFSVVSFFLLFTFAEQIAVQLGSIQFAPSLKLIAITYLLMSPNVFYRGILQSEGEAMLLAKGNVIEQMIRVGSILFISLLYFWQSFSVYTLGFLAMFGSVLALICSILYVRRMRNYMYMTMFRSLKALNMKKMWQGIKHLATDGVSIAISSLVIVLFQFVDSLLYVDFLSNAVAIESAQLSKGVYDRAQPILQLGGVVGSALAIAVIPMVVQMLQAKQHERLRQQVKAVMWVSVVSSSAAGIGLMAVIKILNIVLYEDAVGTNVLLINCASVIFLGYILTGTAVLHSLHRSYEACRNVIIGLLGKIVLMVIFASVFSAESAALSNVLAYALIAFCVYRSLHRHLGLSFFQGKGLLLVLHLLSMWFGVKIVQGFMMQSLHSQNRGVLGVELLVQCSLGALLFLGCAVRTKLLEKEHIELLPFRTILGKWVKK
ncbi:MAG: oligosaccharide flippase family protein [Bacilli bacterium]